MKYCSSCGKQLPDDARFCDGCGTPGDGPTPASSAPRKLPMWVIVAVMLAVLVAGGGAAYALVPWRMSSAAYEKEAGRIAEKMLKVNTNWADQAVNMADNIDGDYIDASNIAELDGLTSRTRDSLSELRDELQELRPPAEYEDAHEDLIDASDYFVDDFWKSVQEVTDRNSAGVDVYDAGDEIDTLWEEKSSDVRKYAQQFAEAADEIGVELDDSSTLAPLF